MFISHHSGQHDAALKVRGTLAKHGIHGWLAPDDVSPGAAFDTQIVAAIERSFALVLLLDGEADQSRHVKREIMLADDGGKPVMPVRLAPMQAEGLAYFLKDRQWVDWFDAKGGGLDQLIHAVQGEWWHRSQPSPMPGSKRRQYRRIALAVLGVLAVAAIGLTTWKLWPGGGHEPYVKPGLWLNKREMIAVTFPKLDDTATQQIRETVENDPNPEECIAEEVARAPDVKLFDPGNKGGCSLTGFQIGSGRMSGYLTCPMQGAKDAVVSIVFRGRYTSDTIVVDQDVTMAQPAGTLKFKARDSSHWVAADCPTDRR